MPRDRHDELVETLRDLGNLAEGLRVAASDCDDLAEALAARKIDDLAGAAEALAKDLDCLGASAGALEVMAEDQLREHTRLEMSRMRCKRDQLPLAAN